MTKTSTLNLPVFYTCTAATPDGPPLEIAWGSLAFETYGVMCGSHLVRPPAAWISELARDAAALQPYGLALSDLREFGTPPPEIAAHMNEALTKRELFSVVLEDDARIRRIFDAAKIAPGFALRITDADELIAELARLQRLSDTVLCLRLVEVEDDRQVAAPAKLLPQPLQDCDPALCEPPEQQDAFSTDRVDDVADFLATSNTPSTPATRCSPRA